MVGIFNFIYSNFRNTTS